jgi:steroid delta-isomerase-like uncharacterized protein
MATGHEDIFRRWFDDIWNRGDVDVADEVLAPQATLHETAAGAGGTQDLDGFKAMASALRRAFPDVRFHVDDSFGSGDRAVARLTVTGTHSGPGLGVAPTGRSFRIPGIVVIRMSDGRIAEGWSSFDLLGLYEQLGVLKRPPVGA